MLQITGHKCLRARTDDRGIVRADVELNGITRVAGMLAIASAVASELVGTGPEVGRAALLTVAIGSTALVADVFESANTIPNVIYMLLAGISKDVECYYDEELDRFRGRTDYGTDEVEEFREVLYTMRSDEVAGWVRSLELRQILLPDDIKDEVFLIVGERRQ